METINVRSFQNDDKNIKEKIEKEGISYERESSLRTSNIDFDNSKAFSFLSFSATYENQGGIKKLETKREEIAAETETNYKCWRSESYLRSVGNFDDDRFKEILAQGDAAIPVILQEMEKGPTPLVRVLDILYPDVMNYQGYTTIEEACNLWKPLLKMI